MSRADRIAEIRRRRARQAQVLERAHTWVTDVLERLRELEALRTELLGQVPDEARSRLTALGAEVNGLLEELPGEVAALDAVAARFRRATLNVGVIGKARQGKSRLIQSLTGLTDQEVPTSDGGFCTGVTSVLRHEEGVPTQAQVYFHSERSFLREVIAPYYAELGLGPAPTTLERFAGPLPSEPSGETSVEGSRYNHLVQYHTALPEYRRYLGMASPHLVSPHEIRRFVAQSDEHDQQRYHTFRAVRYVRITTHFAHQDWTGLSLIDLPGLGDSNLQDAQRIVAALKDEIDVVVFLRRPDPLGDGIDTSDYQLYDHVQEGLPDTGLDRCSFLVINKCSGPKGDNSANARKMAEQWLPASRFTVAEAHIADCSQPDDVAGAMDRVLDYLLAHLDDLDNRYLAVRSEKAAELHERLTHVTAQAERLADLAQPTEIWFLPFTSLFKQTHGQLAHALAALVRELSDERDLTDGLLADAVDTVLEAAERDPAHATPDELVARAAAEDGLSMAYGKYLNESRARLSRRFLECDVALHARTTEMQQRVADVLRGPGSLGGLSTAQDGREFLLQVAARVPRVREDGGSEIRYALQLLADFQLSYRGMLQHRVRACLDGLHADTPTMPFPHQPGPTVQQVREMLEVAYNEALYTCRSELYKALADPSAAIFSIVEEFYDRVIPSAGVEEEWLVFYQDIRAEIWPGRFAALAEDAAHLRRWSESVAAVTTLAASTVPVALLETSEEAAA
ncbi:MULTISPECIES: hypothetical protein [unclassified Streptomyces]|uniref:hypothetical protein n=1 Tax=unclassified Streptomyces TaxID=2593676 RepID=UPI0022576E77|nr:MULTISPECIES: hypothetical protein [unclassified Streptomyces]MCX4405343.1 hypothetical protein [Streptomyces sp. NBC_01764]MCX5190106.1 hypothetical protein [Streptomyces sp. NBC_00268]